MKVIAINGWVKSGKDTAADYLINEYGAKRIAFADRLKEMTAEQYDIDLKTLHQQDLKELPLENYPVIPKDNYSLMIAKYLYKEFRSHDGRRPMDFYVDPSGTFIGVMDTYGGLAQLYWTPRALAILEGSSKRSVNSSYWTQTAIDKVFTLSQGNDKLFVISDLRYKSEAAELKRAFGNKVTIVRINRFDTSPSQDPSERDMDDYKFDVVIENKSTLEEYLNKIKELVK